MVRTWTKQRSQRGSVIGSISGCRTKRSACRHRSFEGLDPYSIEDARDADSKRKVQKKENRLLDIKAESKMTFQELTDWYLSLKR